MIFYLAGLTIWICHVHRKQKIVPQRQMKTKTINHSNFTKSQQQYNDQRNSSNQYNPRPEINNSGDEIDIQSEKFEIESQFSFDFKKPRRIEVTDLNEKSQSLSKKPSNRLNNSKKYGRQQSQQQQQHRNRHSPKSSVSSIFSLDNETLPYNNARIRHSYESNKRINEFFKNSKSVEKEKPKEDFLKIARQLKRPSPNEN